MKKDNIDIVGYQYGYWTVLGESPRHIGKCHHKYMQCRCVCMRIQHVRKDDLVSGKSKSCGCSRSAHIDSLEGQKFNSWKIVSIGPIRNTHRYVLCVCDCGYMGEVRLSAVKCGQSRSCGCTRKGGRTLLTDIAGEEFGHLVALEVHHTHKKSGAYWRCLCTVCGNDTVVQRSNLINGTVSSCGCRRGLGRKVAKLAGCSESAVSTVMHNKWRDRGGVTPELAARVKEIAKEVGYSPWYNTAIT